MTTSQFLELYWPWLLGALVVLLLAIVLLRRERGQRVTLSERDTATRTLSRPVVDASAAPAPLLLDSELTRLKGVGPRMAAALVAEGVADLQVLASLDDSGEAALDAKLGTFAGRVRRDRLVEQARLLTEDPAAYEAAFGKGA